MPPPSTLRQTRAYLVKRFAEVGIRPRTQHGQNFLIDLNLQELLIRTADLEPDDVVLEVGTGTGSLTVLMAPLVAAVVTVELDRQLFQLAREALADSPNVDMLRQDVLKNKNQLHPAVVEAVRARLDEGRNRRFKLLANLPFSVATPVIANLLASSIVPETMTITIQKELADRITAQPSTKDYSALSIWLQSQCQIEIVRVLPPTVFWPQPNVSSAILHIEVFHELRERIPDLAFFHTFVRSLFFHRRKLLRRVLRSALKDRLSKDDVDEVLAELGFAETIRAEQLDIDTLLVLCEAFRARLSRQAAEDQEN